MTRMLASVTGPAEAEVAIAGGADIIDLKDATNGALGAVAPQVVRETVIAIGGRRATSAVTGDLPMQPDRVLAAAQAIAETGVDYVKIGVFPDGDPQACLRAVASLSGRTRLVAVLFADAVPDFAMLPLLAELKFTAAMLDTRDKEAGRLLDYADLPRLRSFVETCRALGLLSGLAGSLETPDVPRLLVLSPDLLGFRGALCGGARNSMIEIERVRTVRALIPQEGACAVDPYAAYRLLAARGYSPAALDGPLADLVFVHDLVLPVRIGAYARERTHTQLVRFDVDATVLRLDHAAEDMRDVFSYDVITDGIRLLIDAGHVDLVETLAERIAAIVLAQPQVVKVLVRVQKLETGSGSVGVAIERAKAEPRPHAGAGAPVIAHAVRHGAAR